jgi:LacI family transcriptional regulator
VNERAGRRQGNVPTISDVARQAGVSPMTVSRVINGEPNVRSTTRDTVKEAIATLRYTPNPAARSLAGATATRIGLLYSNPSAGYLSEFLVGSLDQASRSDVQLVVEKCELGDHEIEVARHLIASGIDGIVLPSPLCDSARLIEVIAAEALPAVVVSSGQPPRAMLAVGIDEFAAAHAMARHLVGLGHRRIGFILGDPAQVASGLRLRGFRAALDEAGLAADPALITQGDFTYRSGLVAAGHLLSVADRPSAIFASNDDMAAATVAVAHRRGLDVPRDLTVSGFDDTTLATAIWPELTTIRQPIAEMARAALELLVTAIRRQRPDDPHRLLDFELIRRQSDASPLPDAVARRA